MFKGERRDVVLGFIEDFVLPPFSVSYIAAHQKLRLSGSGKERVYFVPSSFSNFVYSFFYQVIKPLSSSPLTFSRLKRHDTFMSPKEIADGPTEPSDQCLATGTTDLVGIHKPLWE